jgi:hypothetical protein
MTFFMTCFMLFSMIAVICAISQSCYFFSFFLRSSSQLLLYEVFEPKIYELFAAAKKRVQKTQISLGASSRHAERKALFGAGERRRTKKRQAFSLPLFTK